MWTQKAQFNICSFQTTEQQSVLETRLIFIEMNKKQQEERKQREKLMHGCEANMHTGLKHRGRSLFFQSGNKVQCSPLSGAESCEEVDV